MQIELKQLQRKLGITFIYVTHDQDEALSMSDRIVVLKDGKIEQIASPVEAYENPNSLYVADFLGEANVFEGTITCQKKNVSYVKINSGEELSFIKDGYEEGDKISLIVRPENVKISKIELKNYLLTGLIAEQIYDGSLTKIMIKVGNKIVKSIVLGNDKLYKKGDKVYLYWDIEDAIILRCDNDAK